METLIVIFLALTVLFWMNIIDMSSIYVDHKEEYKRAADLYRGTFGTHYKAWFVRSRKKMRMSIFYVVICALGCFGSFCALGFFLFTYITSK